MATWNSRMESMTWEEDYQDLNSGTIVDGTWYECTNYSGIGRLDIIAAWFDTTTNTGEIRMTLDSNAHIITKVPLANVITKRFGSGDGASTVVWPLALEFQATLVIEGRRDGDTNDIEMWASYGILSEEFLREVIPANNVVLDRNGNPRKNLDGSYKTYPYDVMLVWFRGSHGVSNKVEHPKPHVVDMSEKKLYTTAFDTNLANPRYAKTLDQTPNVTKRVMVDGEMVQVRFQNGVAVAGDVPVFIRQDALWDRFTAAEQETLVNHNNAKVKTLLYELRIRQKVNLLHPQLFTALNGLETAGILGAGRAAEILTV